MVHRLNKLLSLTVLATLLFACATGPEKRARVKILATNERWFGVTYREDKPGVERAIADLVHSGTYPENLWG